MNTYFLIELLRHQWMRKRYIERLLKRWGLSNRRAKRIAGWVV